MDYHPSVKDKGSFVERVDFLDDVGDPTTPLSASWTLTDGNGNTINQRQDVAITPLSPTAYIEVYGDDLDYDEAGTRADNTRIIVVSFTYLSALTGSVLPQKRDIRCLITDLPGV